MANVDGIVYSNAFVMPVTQGDLWNGNCPDPIPLTFNQAFLAVVTFNITGSPATNLSYVIAQTSLDNGVTWFDVAWCRYTVTSTQTFVLSGGRVDPIIGVYREKSNDPPTNTSSNQMPLGGQLRFIGRSTLTGGTNPQVTVNISFKMLGFN